ncbi:MAG: DUF975 family protein [Eubacterium sp.]|nr:DUF975 family protein [Eubacterium sp.]
MDINRPLVKQQAKELIRGNVLKLFFISLIIGLLAGNSNPASSLSSSISNALNNKNSYSDNGGSNNYEDFFDNFDNFGNSDNSGGTSDWGHFDGFNGNGKVGLAASPFAIAGLAIGAIIVLFIIIIFSIIRLALAPLAVMLDGLYWQLIRGNNMSFGDGFVYIFKNTFNKNYWQKFLLQLVKSILLALLYMLLIIPGVIFSYKWRFSTYILAEHPEMSFGDAMRASDKMTKGHKWELFVLDLSFLGWYLLMIPTIGLISIYVTPYVSTTVALYYENFKIRAYQEGAITQFDFLSSQQKTTMYQQSYAQYGSVAAQVQNTNVYYHPSVTAAPVAPMQTAQTYYTPPAPPQPVAPPVQQQYTPQPVQAPAQPQVPPMPQQPAQPPEN